MCRIESALNGFRAEEEELGWNGFGFARVGPKVEGGERIVSVERHVMELTMRYMRDERSMQN